MIPNRIIIAVLVGLAILSGVIAALTEPNQNTSSHHPMNPSAVPVLRDGCRDIAPAGPAGYQIVDDSRCKE